MSDSHKSSDTPLPEPECNNECDDESNKKFNLVSEGPRNSVQYILTDNEGNEGNVEDDSCSGLSQFNFCPHVHKYSLQYTVNLFIFLFLFLLAYGLGRLKTHTKALW